MDKQCRGKRRKMQKPEGELDEGCPKSLPALLPEGKEVARRKSPRPGGNLGDVLTLHYFQGPKLSAIKCTAHFRLQHVKPSLDFRVEP